MKKNKLLVTILVVLILGVLIALTAVIKDMNISNNLYNACFWLVIPLSSIIICSLYLRKHLWLTPVVVFVLDITLWLISLGNIPFWGNNTNMEGIALLSLIIQEAVTLIFIVGIYVYRFIKGRRLLKQ